MFKRKKKNPVQPTDPFSRILMKEFLDARFQDGRCYKLVAVIDEGVRTFYDHTYVLILYSSVQGTALAIKVRRQYEEEIEEFVTEVGKCKTMFDLNELDEKGKIFYD